MKINSNIEQISSKISENNNYSTEETKIGTWINGKPIYRKFIYNNQIAQSTTDVSSLKIDQVIKIDGFGLTLDYAIIPVQYYDEGTFCGFYYNPKNQVVKAQSTRPLQNAYVWIEYTKTTD